MNYIASGFPAAPTDATAPKHDTPCYLACIADALAGFRDTTSAALDDLRTIQDLNRMALAAIDAGDLQQMLAVRNILSEHLAKRDRNPRQRLATAPLPH